MDFANIKLSDGRRSHVCPLKLLEEDDFELLTMFHHYKNQTLPSEGALLDQTGFYIEAMAIMESAWQKHRPTQ